MTTRRNSHRNAVLAGLCLPLLGLGLSGAYGGVGGPWGLAEAYQPGAEATSDDALFEILSQASHDPAVLARAADLLLDRANDPGIARRLNDLLGQEGQPQEGRLALLGALGRAWAPPQRLSRTVQRLAQGPTNAPPVYILPALGAYRTPDAVTLLIKRLSVKEPEGTRLAASEALIAITGRDDLGGDRIAWQRWFEENRSTDDAEWRDALAAGVAQRQARLASERGLLGARMTDALRRLYLALPADSQERAKLLTQLLADPIAEGRNLGLDLLSRELSAGRVIDGAAIEAVAALLESPDPRVRARAAVLTTQLVPTNVAERLAAALAKETSPEAAASLLIAVARTPTPGVVAPVLHWLEQGPLDFPGAVDALLALENRAMLESTADRERALSALRRIETPLLTPSACRLLAGIGNDEDRHRIAALLDGPQSPARAAAAEALAVHPAYLDRLLAAATTDPTLFPVAVEAVVRARPTVEGFASLTLLPTVDAEVRHDGLVRASLVLRLPQLLRVARDLTSDEQLREALLSRLTEPTVEAIPEPYPDDAVSLIDGLYALAQTRLDLKRPDRALAALATLPDPLPEGADAELARRLRTISLLWTNQLDRAAAENSPVGDWLDALELAIAEPFAPQIVTEIRRRFGGSLSGPEVDRLRGLADRLAESSGAPRAAGDGVQIPAGP